MTGRPDVSVVVLNHRRPHLLERVLSAVLQLDYPAFEIVVVGDQPSLAEYRLPGRLAAAVRYARCDEPNICRARNIAVAMAAGEIVAFCDDDAVPEPDWLSRLVEPFAVGDVGAVGGVVRAADGMRLEWDGGMFDRAGTEFPLPGDGAVQHFASATQVERGRFLALRGVNTAFRRAALLEVGGFDEAYRYYLDETDMALRLAEAGWSAALVRGAEVQHLPEQNVARGALRQPRDLFEVAASKAHFCKRHLSPEGVEAELMGWRARRMADLDTHMRLGVLRQADRARLARRFDEGVADGLGRQAVLPLREDAGGRDFAPCGAAGARLSLAVVTGWGPVRIARLRAVAAQLAGAGHTVTCLSYMTGSHPPSVTYREGVWLHRGGTWRLDGGRLLGRGARARAEIARLAARRGLHAVLWPVARAAPAGAAAGLIPVAGMSTPLRVEMLPGRGPRLPDVVLEVRRVIDLPGSSPEGAGLPPAAIAAMPGSPGR